MIDLFREKNKLMCLKQKNRVRKNVQYFNNKKIGWLNLKSRLRNWNKGKILKRY